MSDLAAWMVGIAWGYLAALIVWRWATTRRRSR